MICEAVEAAVRSIKDPDVIKIESMIDKIIKNRIDDGQLDDCPLTLDELNKIKGKVAAVGAHYIGSRTGHPSFFVQFKRFRFRKCFCNHEETGQLIPADMLISSGCLIPLSAIDTIGDMDEELFIDHVDTDWFLRAKSLGW